MEALKKIKNIIKKTCEKVTPDFVINSALNKKLDYINLSYSQEGEDLILERVFEGKTNGFYIDVGAHHPKRFSNTYKFYLKGWRGINIDPLPGNKKLFDKIRPLDINIECGVSGKIGQLNYYSFNEPALNTFSKVEAEFKNNRNGYYIKSTISINTYPLTHIVKKYLPHNIHQIDFLSVDVEGLDLEVLKSYDWKIKPLMVLVEELRTDIINITTNSEIYRFMHKNGYELHFRTYNTSFYKISE